MYTSPKARYTFDDMQPCRADDIPSLSAWIKNKSKSVDLLLFLAGAMIFVVMQELSEEMRGGKGRGLLLFSLGFTVMMSLDVALG